MRQRQRLLFGQGLERASGVLAVDGASFLDLRNLRPRDYKMIARAGLTTPAAANVFTDCTDVLNIWPFRYIKGGVAVCYNNTTQLLTVWRLDGAGENAQLVGNWANLSATPPFPVIVGAEVGGKFFLAHAEPLINERAKTVYFDPDATPGAQVIDLTANLDGAGSASVYFRGVRAYLKYLVGYGFGTAADPNRSEIVRFSIGGQPTTFDKQHYFVAGVAGVPVTNVCPAGQILRVHKRGQSYKIVGTGPKNFGILPLEESYGCVGDRLGEPWGSGCLFWSEAGPRYSEGEPSEDVALPLELDGPEPVALAEAGDLAAGFLVMDPVERLALFGFPIVDPAPATPLTRFYTASLRNKGEIKWFYEEYQQNINCAGVVIEGDATVGTTITAYASAVTAADTAQAGTGRRVNVAWTNNALIGGETAQIYVKVSGTWTLMASVAATGATQNTNIDSVQALADIEVAIRFVKSGVTTAGYTSTDPDSWTAVTAAGAKDTTTTSCSAPVLVSVVWNRVDSATHRQVLTFTLTEQNVGFEMDDSPTGAVWTQRQADVAPYNTRTIEYFTDDSHLQSTRSYRLRAVIGSNDSANSNVIAAYLGPTAIPSFTLFQTGVIAEIDLWLRLQPAGAYKLAVESSPDGSTGWVVEFFSGTVADGQAIPSSVGLAATSHIRARYALTVDGVDDFGEYSGTQTIFLDNTAAPAAPAAFTGSTYNDTDDIDVTFADPTPNNRVLRYLNTVAADSWTFATKATGVTAHEFTDIYHVQANSTSTTTAFPAGTYPAIPAHSAIMVTTGGLRKRSAWTTEAIPKALSAAPFNLVVTQPGGVGTIHVAWDNGVSAGPPTMVSLVKVANDPGATGASEPNQFVASAVTVVGADDFTDGPGFGFPALVAGPDIMISVQHQRVSDGIVTDYASVQYTLI